MSMASASLRIAVIAAITAFTGPHEVASKTPLTMKGVTTEQEAIFLAGAALGVVYTNMNMEIDGKAPLFCAPLNYDLNYLELKAMAAKSLEGPHEPYLFVIAALSNLAKSFPCR